MLKTILFLLFVTISYRISLILGHVGIKEWETAYFKERAIEGVVVDTIKFKPTSKRMCGLVIQSPKSTAPEFLQLRYGCAYVNLLYNTQIGDTLFKEQETNVIRIKSAMKDTTINLDR